jgi:hypothetical protein
MKLSNRAIEKLKASRESRLRLCSSLGFTEVWIDKLIDKNKVNGPLTTVSAIGVIREETELADSEILENETEEPVKGA